MREETDSLGSIEVPDDVYYGAQTARSLIHFKMGHHKMPLPVIHSYGLIKKAAAIVNCELGLLSKDKMELIVKAANEVSQGHLNKHFPLSIWQTGSGTQTNMNVNEVIANRAIELVGGQKGSKTPIHPNDHVNLSQSSNDTFPTAMHLAAANRVKTHLLPMLEKFRTALEEKKNVFDKIIKIGRTHLMDALPMTLGQEFSGYCEQLSQCQDFITHSLARFQEIPIGGTAIGTGFNAPKDFGEKVAVILAQETGFPFIVAKNKFSLIAAHDLFANAHGTLKTLAVALTKIAMDLSWMGSGPRCGLGELIFPQNEPGSSIMPGKVNPTQCEALLMICAHIFGNDQTITIAAARGNFELNVFKPLIIERFLDSITLLGDVLHSFTHYFIEGLKPNEHGIESHVGRSLMLVTALTATIGYDKAAQVAHKAYHENLSLKEACLKLGLLSAEKFDDIVRPDKMI